MLTLEEQDALTSELADQPRHETVRMLLRRLLAEGLGADSRDIDLMEPVPEVHGRVGALLGRTVFEWKFDLMRDRSRPGGQNKTDESRQNGRNLGVGSFIKGSIVTAAESGWLCGTGSLFVRLLSSMNPHFYSWAIASQRVKDFLAAASIGTTMRNLNEGIMHRVPIPVCSRNEQDEVFREVERQYSMLDHIEAAIDSEITKSATLRQSILKQAFAGQLVAQNPSDEPASILLDRIRTKREQAVKNNALKKRQKKSAAA